jgi:hypothetical protein
MTNMFREAPKSDKGEKQIPGPLSMRRALSFILAIASAALFIVGDFTRSAVWVCRYSSRCRRLVRYIIDSCQVEGGIMWKDGWQ